MKQDFKIISYLKKVFKELFSQDNEEKKRSSRTKNKPSSKPPIFRIVRMQKPSPSSIPPQHLRVPKTWGPRVKRSENIPVFHNQQKCIICQESIHFTYQNKGWFRCPKTKKMVHGHCYSAWSEEKDSGCAICETSEHNMRKISYRE